MIGPKGGHFSSLVSIFLDYFAEKRKEVPEPAL